MKESHTDKGLIIIVLTFCIINLSLGIFANYRLFKINKESNEKNNTKEVVKKQEDKKEEIVEENTEIENEVTEEEIIDTEIIDEDISVEELNEYLFPLYDAMVVIKWH